MCKVLFIYHGVIYLTVLLSVGSTVIKQGDFIYLIHIYFMHEIVRILVVSLWRARACRRLGRVPDILFNVVCISFVKYLQMRLADPLALRTMHHAVLLRVAVYKMH